MVKYSAIILLAMLSACATPRVEYKEVKVQVDVVPAPPVIEHPKLATQILTPQQRQNETELDKAYLITILQLEGYAKKLEDVIANYAKMAQSNPTP